MAVDRRAMGKPCAHRGQTAICVGLSRLTIRDRSRYDCEMLNFTSGRRLSIDTHLLTFLELGHRKDDAYSSNQGKDQKDVTPVKLEVEPWGPGASLGIFSGRARILNFLILV